MDRPSSGRLSVECNIMVPMRDGVRLATDIYLPAGIKASGPKPRPVLLERTPYGKSGISRTEISLKRKSPATRAQVGAFFAEHGYAVAMQDCRGRYRSEGRFTKYIHEAEDGFDTLAWLLEQPWCDGRVATMGMSYGAHTQLALACLAPPGLACMFMDSGGFSNAYQGGIRRGGAFELKQATWAYKHALLSPETAADPARKEALEREQIRDWFQNMPWRPGHSPLRAAPEYESYLFEQWRHGRFDAYWKRPGLCAEAYYEQIPDIPIAILGSWYDPYVLTCINNFKALSGRRAPVRLLMGPWTHGNRSQAWAGEVDFGPSSTLDAGFETDYLGFRLAWFDRFLAPEIQTGEKSGSTVSWFEMGGGSGARDENGRLQHGGRWCHSTSWPPSEVDEQFLFFDLEGGLTARPPQTEVGFRRYCYDPEHPVPTIGGALTSGQPVMEGGPFDQYVTGSTFQYCSRDPGGPLANRSDVLVFQTEPLAADLTVCGEIEARLWVSSDCPDTDFMVKLVDVYPPSPDYPHGFAMNICDGLLRARYREGWDREVFLEPESLCRITVVLHPTSNRFCAGHRLRIDISSSNFPQFDLNPNTGEPEGRQTGRRIATNRVHCSVTYPSQVKLPIRG